MIHKINDFVFKSAGIFSKRIDVYYQGEKIDEWEFQECYKDLKPQRLYFEWSCSDWFTNYGIDIMMKNKNN